MMIEFSINKKSSIEKFHLDLVIFLRTSNLLEHTLVGV